MGGGGKAEHVGDVGKRQAAVAQQAADVERGVARNPIRCWQTAHLLADLREILGRDAELVGIVTDVAVPAVIATLQQADELLHQLVLLC